MLTRLKPYLVPATVSLFIVTLLFGKQISVYLVTRNRFFLMWETADALTMIVLVLTLAIVAFGVGVFVARWPRIRRIYDHAYVLLLAGGLLSVIPIKLDTAWMWGVWSVIGSAVVFSCFSTGSRLVLYARNFDPAPIWWTPEMRG